jgi:hypothetical protein
MNKLRGCARYVEARVSVSGRTTRNAKMAFEKAVQKRSDSHAIPRKSLVKRDSQCAHVYAGIVLIKPSSHTAISRQVAPDGSWICGVERRLVK